jgi:hypothetical protein
VTIEGILDFGASEAACGMMGNDGFEHVLMIPHTRATV